MSLLDGEVTSLALCWRLERGDGAGVALTSHDAALDIAGTRFAPASGIVPAAVVRSLGLEPHSADVSGGLSADALTEADLVMGRWDGAAVQLTVADWTDLDAAPVQLLAGTLGGVNVSDDGFSAELHGAAAELRRPISPSTSPECRAHFGDRKCRVDLAGRTKRARVVDAAGATLTIDTEIDPNFVFGRVRFVSGENCGFTMTILSVSADQIVLRETPRGVVESGCVIELREGCDKRFATCVSRFNNAANFRGEPHLPGNDLLTRYPGV